jgi:hypothetical protein
MMEHQEIGIADLISRLKSELLENQDNEVSVFAISGVEVEVSFTVESTRDGGIDIKVIQAGVKQTSADIQTIKIALSPLLTIDELKAELSPDDMQKIKKTVMREYIPQNR